MMKNHPTAVRLLLLLLVLGLIAPAVAATATGAAGQGPFAGVLAKMRADPASFLLERLTTRIGLSEAQRAAIDPLLRPFVEQAKGDRGRMIDDPVALLAKLEGGTFRAEDARGIVDRRLAVMAEREERLANLFADVYAQLDGTQRRILARTALERIEHAGERLDLIERLPGFPIARALGLPEAEASRLRGIALPIVRELIASGKRALGDPAPLAERFANGGFTRDDFRSLLVIRRTVGTSLADRIAEGISSAWNDLSGDLKARAIERAKQAIAGR